MTDNPNAIAKVNKYFESDIVRARFADVVGSDRNAGAYIGSVLLAVANNEKLQECTPASIYTSALRAASLRLSVDPGTKQAYLVPFENKKTGIISATLIIGYMGLYTMAIRTGRYKRINTYPMRGQTVEENILTGELMIVGNPLPATHNPTGWFSIFEFTRDFGGMMHYIYSSVEDIHKHAKKYSRGYDNPKGVWKTNPEAMERKTVLRFLLSQWGYIDPHDAAIVEEIEDGSKELDALDDGNTIDGQFVEGQHERRSADEIIGDFGYED